MTKLTEKIFHIAPLACFTSQDLAALFPQDENKRYALVKRAIASGEIIHIRKGLYCLDPKYQRKTLNIYSLAQRIYGPSYISLESALSWHGWIPEAVYALTSVSLGKAKTFDTPLGLFSYNPVPQNVFYTAVQRLTDDNGDIFLIASPLKALADYIYIHKSNWTGLAPVLDSLRIELDQLQTITLDDIDILIENYNNRAVKNFLKGLSKDLNL